MFHGRAVTGLQTVMLAAQQLQQHWLSLGFLLAALLYSVAVVWYSVWLANRLDRLNIRLDLAAGKLQGALDQRAALYGLWHADLKEQADRLLGIPVQVSDMQTRARAEETSARSRPQILVGAGAPDSLPDLINRAELEADLAVRMYNVAVSDVLALRENFFCVVFQLSGHAPWPTFFDATGATPLESGEYLQWSARTRRLLVRRWGFWIIRGQFPPAEEPFVAGRKNRKRRQAVGMVLIVTPLLATLAAALLGAAVGF